MKISTSDRAVEEDLTNEETDDYKRIIEDILKKVSEPNEDADEESESQ